MDYLKRFLLNNASLQSRPRRRRHSIADVRFLHTLNDIPEKPEEEESEKAEQRRRSTGNLEHEERIRCASEPPPGISTQCCNEDASTNEANYTRVCPSVEHERDESPRYKRSLSLELSCEENEQLLEAVSTYVLSYTDDAGNVCNADDVSPTTTGSTSPQESSKDTSDEELSLSEMLRNADTPMLPQRSRRGSMIDPDVMERITALTPIVEYSRSSSCVSLSASLNEPSLDINDHSEGNEAGSRLSSTKNVDNKEGVLGKILVSPRLTRKGSLSDVLMSLSPQFDTTPDLGRQGTDKLSSAHLSPHVQGLIKDPWRPLSPMNFDKGKTERDENPNLQTNAAKNDSQTKMENGNVLGKIMNSPSLLKRRGSLGEVLRTLSPHVASLPSIVVDTSLRSAAEKEHESVSPNKDKDDLLGKIINSTCLTRRGSIGNLLNVLSPNHNKKCPSPSPLTIKCNTNDYPSEKTSPVSFEVPNPKDVERAPCDPDPKGLLAIVQQHVINHSQAMQRKRRNSTASDKPHTETLESSLRESLDAEQWGTNPFSDCKSPVVKTATTMKDPSSNKNNIITTSNSNSSSSSSSNSNNNNNSSSRSNNNKQQQHRISKLRHMAERTVRTTQIDLAFPVIKCMIQPKPQIHLIIENP
ncbi:hypothetical protein OS493_017179 [Desmophyllum pertusum]|uniref:Uncharacterized protein n=1 Tax=Desmophyllum pertusum TaxID=174260 RepID=A0A9W9YFL2_9CNID|nr:hypothetical protein OS493_017179 [Desmophyllum pertusum]